MSVALAEIRSLLSLAPTANRWWQLAELLSAASSEEQTLLFDYLQAHFEAEPLWKKAHVPCSDWPEEHHRLYWALPLPLFRAAYYFYVSEGHAWCTS